MSVRHSLRISLWLQKIKTFWDLNVQCAIATASKNLFIALLPTVERSESKAAGRAVCAVGVPELPTVVREGAVTLKGSHRMGDGRDFSKNLRGSLFNKGFSNEPYFRSISQNAGIETNEVW
jgi:hypothetical protein